MNRFFYFKLATTNIKKNGKTYIPYTIASIFTICMYYILHSLANNPDLNEACKSESISLILGLGLAVCAIFAVIFLFYTNSFLIKRRKKEFGLYNILGMEKKHISRVVLCETLIISIVSLALGILVGILLDKLMMLLILSLFSVDVILGFHISLSSIINTLTLFAFIFFIIFLNSVRQIHLSKPIELLKGSSAGEKEPKAKWIITILGIICLGSGYYIAITTTNPMAIINQFFIAVILVIIGTYLLFTSGSIVILKIMRKNKNYYYKTKNFISVSSMIYRMKQNAIGLANICILSTMVLVMVSSTASLWSGINDIIKQLYPHEISFTGNINDYKNHDLFIEELVDNTLDEYNVKIKNETSYKYLKFVAVKDDINLTLKEADNSTPLDKIKTLYFLTLDGYNQINNENRSLNDGEVLIYTQGTKYDSPNINIAGNTFKIKEKLDKPIANTSRDIIDTYFIVLKDDQILNDIYTKQKQVYKTNASDVKSYYGFDLDADSETILSINSKLNSQLTEIQENSDEADRTIYDIQCREESKSDILGMYAGLLFIGVFLGVLFMMATILIMYYKQISEGYEDKNRFDIMQKVGISHDEIKKSIHSQVLLVFFLPLVVAGIHIAFAFPFITRLLAVFYLTNTKLFAISTVIAFLIFSLFYAVVYKITAKSYYKIVSQN